MPKKTTKPKPARYAGLTVQVGSYNFTWEHLTCTYVVSCVLLDVDTHIIYSQGTTMEIARAAMDSAVDLTIKNWPPRKNTVKRLRP